MTRSHDRILTEYRDADFNRRLSMYLRYRQLRAHFILIDQDDMNPDLPNRSNKLNKGRRGLNLF